MSIQPPPYDTVLRGATLIDGTGRPGYKADLALAGDRIAAVGELHGARAAREIDVRDRYVAPGFIDAHGHDDLACLIDPSMEAKIGQGVTTVVVGHCGISLAPLSRPSVLPEPLDLLGDPSDFRFSDFRSYFEAVDAVEPGTNVVSLVGHNTLRVAAMREFDRKASPGELSVMLSLLDEAMCAGAVGLSSGVYYALGRAADNGEIVPLVEKVAEYGGVYTTHARDEFELVLDTLSEALAAARIGGAPVIVSSFRCAGPPGWERTAETVELLDRARATQEIGLDCCPYPARPSVLDPDFVQEDERVLVTRSRPYPEAAGEYLHDLASDWGCSQREAAHRLLPGGACYFGMNEDDVNLLVKHPAAMIGTGGFPVDTHPHPGQRGAFPRMIRRHAGEQRLLPIEAAVRKMTGLTADWFHIEDRGVLAEGNYADIVVFDRAAVVDRASYEDPNGSAAGIDYVFVNGCLSWQAGGTTSSRAGRLLKGRQALK